MQDCLNCFYNLEDHCMAKSHEVDMLTGDFIRFNIPIEEMDCGGRFVPRVEVYEFWEKAIG